MRTLAFALAATMIGTVAFADTTVIKKEEGPFGDRTTVRKETDDGDVSKKTIDTTGAVGCETRSKTQTNAFGDTKTQTKTECD